MNISTTTLFLLMLLVFVAAEVSCHFFKIYKNSYYSVFHFIGGGLTYLLLLKTSKNILLSFGGVLIVGILWEIHELILWKYFLKKKIYKPENKDTINDIILDILGAISIYLLALFY